MIVTKVVTNLLSKFGKDNRSLEGLYRLLCMSNHESGTFAHQIDPPLTCE